MSMPYITNVLFNGVNLNTLAGVNITNFDTVDLPSRNLTMSKLARQNRSVLTSAEYSSKVIHVTGYIGADDYQDLQDRFTTLKSVVQLFEGSIIVPQSNDTIEYIGTLNAISKEYVGKNLNFTLEFTCADPIGHSTTISSLFDPLAITTASATQAFTVLGSSQATPRFSITYTSVTGGTSKTVSITDQSTGKGITVTATIATGNVLTINSDTFEILLNSTPLDYDGQFPIWDPGQGSLQYVDTLTTRSATMSVTYKKNYI